MLAMLFSAWLPGAQATAIQDVSGRVAVPPSASSKILVVRGRTTAALAQGCPDPEVCFIREVSLLFSTLHAKCP